MEIEYLKLIKIDHENNTVSEENLAKLVNIKNYVMAIVKQITDIDVNRVVIIIDGLKE